MYQRNQQQQLNRDNYNNIDVNYDSSESDSSDSDADMDDQQAENENMPANNPSNNNEEDEPRPHNDILERIDYQMDNGENAANIADDARPDAFDENSRGNYELPILGKFFLLFLLMTFFPKQISHFLSCFYR